MGQRIRVTRLGAVLGGWVVNVVGAKISENRNLACAQHATRGSGPDVVEVDEQDHDRWCAATDALVARIRELQEREEAVSEHLHPPLPNRTWWYIRNAKRNRRLRRNYDAVVAELRADFEAALTDYRRRAGDLESAVAAIRERERERQRQRAEEQRRKRAEAMAKADGPVWAYDDVSNAFRIYLTELDDPPSRARTGLTPRQVHEALTHKRAEKPDLIVSWGPETERALRQTHETTVNGWQALTGEKIIPIPLTARSRPRRNRYHGPSSTYGTDVGFSF